MKKKVLAAIIVAMTVFTGCGQEELPSPIITTLEPESIATESTQETVTEEVKGQELAVITERKEVDGKMQSYLTGEWKDTSVVQRRSLAIMIPNNGPALPQYGISKASIIYEAPMEKGSCTRLMGIFEDYDDLDRIGPVRSSRDYFVYEAMAYDSIYLNWGLAVPYVAPLMEDKRIDHISNAVSGQPRAYSAVFDRVDRGAGYPKEFTGYVYVDKIPGGISHFGYDTEYHDTFEQTFLFAEEGCVAEYAEYDDASTIIPGGGADTSGGYQEADAYFEYNAEDKLYYRYQNGKAHTDEMNGEQLTCSNVVFKICYGEQRDPNGYLAFAVHGEGDAYVFTNGKVIPATWERKSDYEPNRYYDMDGNEIVLNQGKTWVCNIWSEYEDCIVYK